MAIPKRRKNKRYVKLEDLPYSKDVAILALRRMLKGKEDQFPGITSQLDEKINNDSSLLQMQRLFDRFLK